MDYAVGLQMQTTVGGGISYGYKGGGRRAINL